MNEQTKNSDIERLANELSIETDDVSLDKKDGIERAFHIQQATNLIKKGYGLIRQERSGLRVEEVKRLFETFQLTTDHYDEKDFPCIPQWNFEDLINFICKRSPQGLKPLSKDKFNQDLFNHFGGCIIKEHTGDNIYDRFLTKFALPNEGLNEKCLTSILSELEDELASNWGIKNTRRSYAHDYAKRILSALENKR